MKVRVIKRYFDVATRAIREVDGKTFEVSEERGRHLIKEGVAEEAEETKAAKKG